MENEYNQLLATSKDVGDFYENVYAPIMQALPWLEPREKSLQNVAGRVLPNLAFPAFQFSSYKDKEGQEDIAKIVARRDELNGVNKVMQDDLRPMLVIAGIKDNNWKQFASMTTHWKKLAHHNLLPKRILTCIKSSYAESLIADADCNMSEVALAKLIADKIKVLLTQGKNNHDITMEFGVEGHWLGSYFLDCLRHL